MKKFFDVNTKKYLNWDEKDIVSFYYNAGFKIKNKYYRSLFDEVEQTYYIFACVKTLKELSKIKLDPEHEYVIKWAFNHEYYHDTYNARKSIPFPDTYELNPGDKCLLGNLTNCSIIAKDERGYYYIKHYPAKWEINKNPEIANTPSYTAKNWSHVYPVVENPVDLKFDSSDVIYSNCCIDGLLTKYFHFGIDLNPKYQRGNVWTEEQKVKLIDSIYRDINIGSIVLVEKQWFNEYNVVSEMYEVLDGKQRLTTIIDYISSKFKYRGKYYYELSENTRHEFENKQILVGNLKLNRESQTYNRKKVLEQFIRLNECGTSMEKSIIDNAKKMIEDENNE